MGVTCSAVSLMTLIKYSHTPNYTHQPTLESLKNSKVDIIFPIIGEKDEYFTRKRPERIDI